MAARIETVARRAFVYQEVDLKDGVALRFRGASGLQVRGETGALCVALDRRYAFVEVGRAYPIGADTVMVFPLRPTRVVVAGEVRSARGWSVRLVSQHAGMRFLSQKIGGAIDAAPRVGGMPPPATASKTTLSGSAGASSAERNGDSVRG